MSFRKRFVLCAVVMLVLASLACQAAGGVKTAPTSQPASSSSPAETPTKVQSKIAVTSEVGPLMPEPVASQGAGKACVGFRDGGLSCLDENGWKTFNTQNSDLPSDYLQAAAFCPDGRLAIAHYSGISLFDGKKWEHIPQTQNYNSADGIACDKNGGVWIAHYKGVSHYRKGEWKTYGAELLATGESANELVYDVAVGADGKVWAVTSRSVAMFEDGQWTVFQKGQGFNEDMFFNSLTLDATGRPWVGHSRGAAVYEDGNWKLLKKNGYDSINAIVLDAHGQFWLGTSLNGVSVFNGSTWTNYNREAENLSSNRVNALASDTLGRVWVGTSYGLSVFDGENWQTYRMENADLADNNVKFIAVTKDGPVLPALANKEKASLTGKLEDADKKPFAGKRVLICVETLGTKFSGDTPCDGQPFFLSTQTDDKGVFLFENIPAGYYVIVAETETGWAQLTDQFGIGSERTLIKAGEKHDIGTLTLKKK